MTVQLVEVPDTWEFNPMYYLTAIHKYDDMCKVGYVVWERCGI